MRESGEAFTRLYEDVEELFIGADAPKRLPKMSGRPQGIYDEPPTRRQLGGYRTAAHRTRLSAIKSVGGGAEAAANLHYVRMYIGRLSGAAARRRDDRIRSVLCDAAAGRLDYMTLVAAGPGGLARCPVGHALQPRTAVSGICCDSCGKTISGRVFECRACDHDLCDPCAITAGGGGSGNGGGSSACVG